MSHWVKIFHVLTVVFLIYGCAYIENKKQATSLFPVTEGVVVWYPPVDDSWDEVGGWVGHIYMNYDGLGPADAVVLIRVLGGRATWSLSEETVPGYYATNTTVGKISNSGWLVDFPHDGFAKAMKIWVAGGIKATINGKSVPPR